MVIMFVQAVVLLILLNTSVYSAPMESCNISTIDCLCGEAPNKVIKTFEIERQNDSSGQSMTCSSMDGICANYSCIDLPPTAELRVSDNVVNITSTPEELPYPVKMVLSEENTSQSLPHQRFRRYPKTCAESLKPLKNAIITCWLWPNFVTCDFNCTHGYAFRKNGTILKNIAMTCRESESYWSPEKTFPVCEPFINCQTVLVGPGDLNCKSSMTVPPYCDISCLSDGEHDDVPKKRYECIDSMYAENLPHCASVKKNVILIENPDKA